ncbi:MAG: T9SS type A sorting domain-containing protein [Saprospiraceae bacterium]|nr:T9SS type A sorting domain-containing protein [Saprospiraceae bacterium]
MLSRLALLLFCSLIAFTTQSQVTDFQSKGIGGGGALFSPSINPQGSDEIYLASDLGGLYHTENAGLKYDVIHFTQAQSSPYSKVCYTQNPGIRYSLLYDANSFTTRPARTSDGGTTWNFVPGDTQPGEDKLFIFSDYNQPQRLIWSDYNHVFLSLNGGMTSKQIWAAADFGAGVLLSGVFWDDDVIYLGTNEGVLISTDGGSTFVSAGYSGIPANERIIGFGAGRAGNLTRFFALTADMGDVYATNLGDDYWGLIRGVYRMDNMSGNWQSAMAGIDLNSDYAVYLNMAVNDPSTCYIAGSEPGGKANVLRTVDGGQSWERIFLTSNNQNIYTGYSGEGGDLGWTWGGNALGFTVNPLDSKDVLFTDYGFIHRTRDGGNSWHQAYLDPQDENPANNPTPKKKTYHGVGMEQTTTWQVYWFDSTTLFSCFTDIKGIRSTDSGESWSFDYTGHNHNTMYRIDKHQTQDIWFAATSSVHDIYQTTYITDQRLSPSYRDGHVLWSPDKGKTWSTMRDFDAPVIWVAADPSNFGRLYAGVVSVNPAIGGVWRADGINDPATATWTKVPNPPANVGRIFNIQVLTDGTLVTTWSARKHNSASIFSDSSGVFVSQDGGLNWEDRSHPDMAYWTKDLVIDPFDPTQSTWYACVWSGWGGPANDLGRLFRTTDRGLTWSAITGDAQFHRVSSVTVDPLDAETMYLTTEGQGLWVTTHKSDALPQWTLVDAYPFWHPERVFFNPFDQKEMWVASFGNGMRVAKATSTSIHSEEQVPPLLTILSNPTKNLLQLKGPSDRNVSIFIWSEQGQQVRAGVVNGALTLDLHDLPEGTYYLQSSVEGHNTSQAFILLH